MKITEVNIILIKPNKGHIGFASIVIDDSIYLGSIGIHTKLNGDYRLTYPTKIFGNQQSNLFHPINAQASKIIENVIFSKLEELQKKGNIHEK